MAKLDLNTAPTEFPISVDENLRIQLGAESDEWDAWLADAIKEATDAAEGYCWSRFVTQTWKQYFDAFSDVMPLAYSPVQTISSVTYVDGDGNTQPAATSLYELGELDLQGISAVRLKYAQFWPVCRGHADDVCVTFVCGYGTASVVPSRIKKAIRLYVAHVFRFREGEQPVPQAFYDLLRDYSFRRVRTAVA